MRKNTNLDLTEGPILRKLLIFAFPLILNSLINNLYSTADTLMIGRFRGTAAMAAVGASGQPINLLVNLFAGLAMGVNVNCGNLKGAKKDDALSECMHTCVLLGLLVGVTIAVSGTALCGPLLSSMNTPEDILDKATRYMMLRLSFGPVWMLTTFCTHILYGMGNTRFPTVTSICSGFLNVLFNAIFVVGFGMEVEGVALATGISQLVNAAALLYILFSPKGEYRLSFSKLRIRLSYVKSILSVGIPSGLSNIIFSLSNVLLQSCINNFGVLVVAGNTASDSVVHFINLTVTNTGAACVSATAQCHGARKLKRVDEMIKKALPSCLLVLVCLNIPATIFGKKLIGFFDANPLVAEYGYSKLMVHCWGYLFAAFMHVFSGCLRGFRKANAVLLCNLFGTITPRLLWIWLVAPHVTVHTYLYFVYPITWMLTGFMMMGMYIHTRKKLENLPNPAIK